jgi:hypothetical protein
VISETSGTSRAENMIEAGKRPGPSWFHRRRTVVCDPPLSLLNYEVIEAGRRAGVVLELQIGEAAASGTFPNPVS